MALLSFSQRVIQRLPAANRRLPAMTWLEKTPWWLLVVIALALALAPFGDSHLLQKSGMLFGGTLRRPLDWFDLIFHAAPLLLLIAKAILILRKR